MKVLLWCCREHQSHGRGDCSLLSSLIRDKYCRNNRIIVVAPSPITVCNTMVLPTWENKLRLISLTGRSTFCRHYRICGRTNHFFGASVKCVWLQTRPPTGALTCTSFHYVKAFYKVSVSVIFAQQEEPLWAQTLTLDESTESQSVF